MPVRMRWRSMAAHPLPKNAADVEDFLPKPTLDLAVQWSNLPVEDVFQIVAGQLPAHDFFQFALVNQACRMAAQGARGDVIAAEVVRQLKAGKRVEARLVEGCPDLVLPEDGLTAIGTFAFYQCPDLTTITLPNSVTTIGSGAFYGCSKLTHITLPPSVTTIGQSAFEDCTSLKAVAIPALQLYLRPDRTGPRTCFIPADSYFLTPAGG